jgi:Fe-S cluster biogenesis protein NfuA
MTEPASSSTLTQRVSGHVETLRQYVQADGGDIELVKVDEETGIVSIRFQGACRGCPGAAMTLKLGIERALREREPGVKEVVSVH